MRNILYISNIDWKWIAQRPQIIALSLEKRYQIKVVWGNTLVHRWKAQHNKYPQNYAKGIILPLQEKFKLLRLIHQKSIKIAIGNIFGYDLIWICDPRQIVMIPKEYAGHIAYDCMDNYIEMVDDKASKKYISKCEKEVIRRADLIFASSQYLVRLLNKKYGRDDTVLIRNGVDNIKDYDVIKSKVGKSIYDIAYVGTVASWVDLDLLYKTSGNGIKYHIIGPLTDRSIDPVVEYVGVIEHQMLYNAIKDWDCLIMPFKLNKIIRAVDPVKLYEYISFGKCIISIYYKEIERFSDFVYFYHDEKEYIKLINHLKQIGFPPKYNKEQQVAFLENNNWEKRVNSIINSLESIHS